MSIALATVCRAVGLPEPVAEHRFHPLRKWRFDWAWVPQRCALEVQGGLFVGGRHARGPALMKEHEKLNAAAALGWRVCYVTPAQVRDGSWLPIIEAALKGGL